MDNDGNNGHHMLSESEMLRCSDHEILSIGSKNIDIKYIKDIK